MKRYLITPAAHEDLRQILEYIAQNSPAAALKVLRDLAGAMRKIARSPGIGRRIEDLADETLRFWTVHSYMVVYRDGITPVQIVRIPHGARDITAILDDSDLPACFDAGGLPAEGDLDCPSTNGNSPGW
jgi:plasmid stabilization system protein ParE